MFSFHILYALHFLICPWRLLVVYWPKPLSDLDLRTASKITCNVLPGVYEDNDLHSKPNCSLLICIQRSYGNSHRWNLYLFKRLRLTYPDGNITYSAITQGSNLPPTGNNPQCTTVIFPWHHTLYLIGADVPIWACFPPTLSYKHPLTLRDA